MLQFLTVLGYLLIYFKFKGANSHGQLGDSTACEYIRPTIINLVSGDITAISLGGGHSIILNNLGQLFVTGQNTKGQLGIGSKDEVFFYIWMDSNLVYKTVSSGWDSSAAITIDDKLYVWGSNSHQQIGFPKETVKLFTTPTELTLPNNEVPTLISFGLRFMVVLCKSNRIYIIGSCRHFLDALEIFHGKIESLNGVDIMELNPETIIIQISCGQKHVVLLDEHNRIYAIGDNKFQQCQEIKIKKNVIKICSGWTHNGFLTESKHLYLYGRNNYGQLGNGVESESSAYPQKCPIHPVDDFALGAEHCIIISNNDIYTFGWNEHANCGHESIENM